jgi:AcrR family transcriptional regulator
LRNRPYVSPLRAEQAQQTQRRVIDAAHRLLRDQGYASTTMAGVAEAAGVSVQTVYKGFGTKPALVKRVYDVLLVGDDAPIPLAERPEVRALEAEPDPGRYLMGYAELGRQLLGRLGPLYLVLLAGARAGEQELQAFVRTVDGERLIGSGFAAQHVAELGGLRPGLSVERARDAIWSLNSVDVWSLLVEQRGWTADEYAVWVGRAMCAAVLDPRLG